MDMLPHSDLLSLQLISIHSNSIQGWEKDMVDKKDVANMYDDAEVFQSSILETRQAEHAAEMVAAEERARAQRKQKKVQYVKMVIILF